MDTLERVIAIEEIKRLKARYFRCMDTKDWDGFAGVFAPDAAMDMTSEMPAEQEHEAITRGNQEIAAFVRSHVGDVVTVHHGHMPEIDVTSPTTATGVWAMEDMLRWPDGSPLRAMHGYGHYHETYTKIDGEWRIATLRLTRLRVDLELNEPLNGRD
jgi:SnoaL-like protein